ncbi:MAG: glutamate-cysteine ligase family protein [Cyclobacteriaceae bacterium]
MSTTPSRLHLFQAFGIELEYMIVDRDSLEIRSIADKLLYDHPRAEEGERNNGSITWSNELVSHVIELKLTKPEFNLNAAAHALADNVVLINQELSQWGCQLMPGAAHPWMSPAKETRLWPYDHAAVYQLYDKIFGCSGHGWSNLQSTHLNLPFYDDEEFARLHAAIRVLLPILPALCASSPVLDGSPTGKMDTRMHYYKTNQSAIPSITGKIIPEAIYSRRQYGHQVYDRIREDLAAFDPDKILDPVWVNSRGAIPRFDRGSIEIRVMDIQECPAADVAIVQLVIETLRALVGEELASHEQQMSARTEILSGILDDCTVNGMETEILSSEYLALFGIREFATAGEIWATIVDQLKKRNHELLDQWKPELDVLLREGNLASRILRVAGQSPEELKKVYARLCGCLQQNKMFIP